MPAVSSCVEVTAAVTPRLGHCLSVGMQASLSAALLVGSYVLQQRFRPFIVSTTLSASLNLDAGQLEQKLHVLRERNAVTRRIRGKGQPNLNSQLRRKSRGMSTTLSPPVAEVREAAAGVEEAIDAQVGPGRQDQADRSLIAAASLPAWGASGNTIGSHRQGSLRALVDKTTAIVKASTASMARKAIRNLSVAVNYNHLVSLGGGGSHHNVDGCALCFCSWRHAGTSSWHSYWQSCMACVAVRM
jgi:hypothetical protein